MNVKISNHYMWFNDWLKSPDREYSTGISWFVKADPKKLALIPPSVGHSTITNPDNYYHPTWMDIAELEKLGLEFLKCSAYDRIEKIGIFERLGT